jgi:hypothetical protein
MVRESDGPVLDGLGTGNPVGLPTVNTGCVVISTT